MRELILNELNKNINEITNYYKELISHTKQNKSVGSVNEWIIDNYYLISEQKIIIKNELKSKEFKKIPFKRKNEINILIYDVLKKTNFKLSSRYFFKYINEYQNLKKDYFSYTEINYINTAIRILIIKQISELSDELKYQFNLKNELDEKFKLINKKREENKTIEIDEFIKIDKNILDKPFYIEALNYKINDLGDFSEELFKKLNELLLENNVQLKDIIKKEHDNMTFQNVCMVNLFDSLKKSIKYKIEFLYANISFTEKLLMSEEADYYDKMYESSKIEYREKLKEKVRKHKIKEIDYAKKIVKRANDEKKHIGFLLFDDKNYNLRAVIYIFTIIFSTILLSFVISIKLGFFSFILLIIPVCGFITDLVSQILQKTVKTKSLFRLKLENDVSKEFSTMIVIPTIIKNTDKIEEMFGNLETYYLSNRTDNLYYTLLADASSEIVKDVPFDNSVVEYGLKKVKELNKKYNKNLFHFVYRNRFYSKSEEAYLGYERKRGALIHFNSLLLNKFNEEEKKLYFRCQTFDDFEQKIKYVITLDADTKLLLNTASKLIGTMVHPMNRPVLSKDNKKVISGYAIMQPRISIDVEVTNKSKYSQLFAGLGGLDIYTTKAFDLYQDVFNEGSFVGKGIYDLEIFDKILSEAFPENLILSHDLIEGNYLRCGFISDVELFDNYPSKYLNDAMRHHRWTRGDWQIISWLKKNIKNLKQEKEKNPINLIGKWKIFDNLRRSLRSVSLLLLILYGFALSSCNPTNVLLFIFVIIATPIFFYLVSQVFVKQKYDVFLKYYLNLITGFLSVLLKSFVVLSLIPYESILYLNAIIKSIYRMTISKKNLLNWITSDEVDRIAKNNLLNYIKSFKANYAFALVIVFLAYYFKIEYLYLAVSLSIIWILTPVFMYFLSKDIKNNLIKNEKVDKDIRELANKTWKFFNDFLKKEYNYLIPDNYQLNRKQKIDLRTSPTNIGFSIVSTISAYELKIINEDEAIEKINNIIKSVEKLEKWNGHLYNWYNISDKKAIQPFFISTADSGNFVASLFVLKGFLEKNNIYKVLLYRVNKLIDQTDFSKLYNHDIDVFSVGYNVSEQLLVPFHYNNFLSETRVASFIAIAKGDVPFKHWFCLDKTLTKYKNYKGVVSWTGTIFEYYMPLIFMKSFEHTLLDETYLFSYYVQKEFIKEIDSSLPWGITESAYNELDDSQSYKYKAFGVPYLKFHDNENPQIIISPYGSLMVLPKYTSAVYSNMKKLKKLDMYGEYGFYEAYDNEDKVVVKSYYSHHQGMILSSIANHLKKNKIQDYFHGSKKIQSIEILLKEKVQIRPYIDLKIEKYKKHSYKRTEQFSDIRYIDTLNTIPEVGILSNGFYSIFLNDRGIGFSKYKNLQINRYRKITDENFGMFIYIKDLKNNVLFGNTYAPVYKKPDNYHVVFASDRIKYMREDNNLVTTTEITVAKDHNSEIRKITIENNSEKEAELEITSYSEIILSRIEEDVSHRAFNSLTISSEVDEETESLIFKRSSRTKDKTEYFVINRMFLEEEDDLFEYETSRSNFIGRNNNTSNPDSIIYSRKLNSNHEDLIDPISSIRKKIKIKPNSKKTIYYIVGFGKSKEQVMEIVNTYNDSNSINNAFDSATVLNNMRNTYANLTGRQMSIYNTMLKYIYQTLPITENRNQILETNNLSQSGLWKFGISGDLPLITLNITKVEDIGFIKELLQAFEFYKSRAIYIDFVIINNETESKKDLITKYINDLMYRINNLNYFENSNGNVYTINELSIEEFTLLKTYSKIYIDSNINKTFNEQISTLDSNLNIEFEISKKELLEVEIEKDKNMDFYNEFGGFINSGKEYKIVNKNTPMPWSNVIANKDFGTVLTNNLGGFTYLYNSREFKLTSWSNDAVTDPYSEMIFINKKQFNPSYVIHGFGYTKYISKTKDFDLTLIVFVPENDNVKIYNIEIERKTKNLDLEFDFSVRPVLGTSEEQTNRHIFSEFNQDKNCVIFQNVYNTPFKFEKMFISSNLKIEKFDNSKVSKKTITVKSKDNNVTFLIGSANNFEYILKKYNDLSNIEIELNNIKDYWNNKFSNIKVRTPDKSFDYVVNGWYLYQIYASRIYSKAAFYQVGGATGFRDQLQDSMGLIHSDSEFTRNQILKQAQHQFIEGDVLHWWHEELLFGARTKFSDDYLWLIYVTSEYIKHTKDYSILDEKVCFVEGESLSENQDEKGITYSYSNTKETLYYHLKLCINKALNQYGINNLPLMGSGDWNDGMSKVGSKGLGESVWVGFFLYDCLLRMSELSKDDKEFSNMCLNEANILKQNINKNAFDENWYLRAFFDDHTPLGSIKNEECQIDLISQAWSILTEVIEKNKIPNLIKEVEERLVDKENNIIKLLDPPFEKKGNNPGYISDYIKGVRENGGQYTHAALWYVMALIKIGKVDEAYNYYSMINPINRTKEESGVLKYQTEPYVIAADIYSNIAQKGRGGWTWYTGSASWAYKIAIEEILGLKRTGDVLNIKPNITSKWNNVEIEYKYKETVYKIFITKSENQEILLDNKKVDSINLVNDLKKHKVEVKIGGKK